jgi:hypothetical protein
MEGKHCSVFIARLIFARLFFLFRSFYGLLAFELVSLATQSLEDKSQLIAWRNKGGRHWRRWGNIRGSITRNSEPYFCSSISFHRLLWLACI